MEYAETPKVMRYPERDVTYELPHSLLTKTKTVSNQDFIRISIISVYTQIYFVPQLITIIESFLIGRGPQFMPQRARYFRLITSHVIVYEIDFSRTNNQSNFHSSPVMTTAGLRISVRPLRE